MNFSVNNYSIRPQFKGIRIPTDEREQINPDKAKELDRKIYKTFKKPNGTPLGGVDAPDYHVYFFDSTEDEKDAARMLVDAGVDFQWSRKIDKHVNPDARIIWAETGIIPTDEELANYGKKGKREPINLDEAIDRITGVKNTYTSIH